MGSSIYGIFIVEDHPLMRRGYTALINVEPDMVVCGEAGSVAEALEKISSCCPDLIIVDISLEGMSGIELIKQLSLQPTRPRILVVSVYDEALYAERALHAGANGYIVKNEADQNVICAIRKILKGGLFLSDCVSNKLLQHFSRQFSKNASPLERLSDRELETFELIGRGLTTRQIADLMHISPKTVESHRGRIKSKLVVHSTSELRKRAVLWVHRRKTM